MFSARASCPRRCSRPRSAVPHTMFSASQRRAPHDVLAVVAARRAPHDVLGVAQRAPDDVLADRRRAPHDVLAVEVDVPQTMFSASSVDVPHTMFSPSAQQRAPHDVLAARVARRAPDRVQRPGVARPGLSTPALSLWLPQMIVLLHARCDRVRLPGLRRREEPRQVDRAVGCSGSRRPASARRSDSPAPCTR